MQDLYFELRTPQDPRGFTFFTSRTSCEVVLNFIIVELVTVSDYNLVRPQEPSQI